MIAALIARYRLWRFRRAIADLDQQAVAELARALDALGRATRRART